MDTDQTILSASTLFICQQTTLADDMCLNYTVFVRLYSPYKTLIPKTFTLANSEDPDKISPVSALLAQSKEDGKDQESIQSSTTPYHHMGKWQKHKEISNTKEPRGQSFYSR